jgi:hypothetical protein
VINPANLFASLHVSDMFFEQMPHALNHYGIDCTLVDFFLRTADDTPLQDKNADEEVVEL